MQLNTDIQFIKRIINQALEIYALHVEILSTDWHGQIFSQLFEIELRLSVYFKFFQFLGDGFK